jgi:hypoxanthine phosphoribosyltransferase
MHLTGPELAMLKLLWKASRVVAPWLYEVWAGIPWTRLKRDADRTLEMLKADGVVPDTIISAGMGGDFLGRRIQGKFLAKREVQLRRLVCEAYYVDGTRHVRVLANPDDYRNLGRVLVVMGRSQTGQTKAEVQQFLRHAGAIEIHSAALLEYATTISPVDYCRRRKICLARKLPWDAKPI